MSRTVTCAPGEACAVSGSVFAGNGGASEEPSPSGRSVPPAADDEDDDAVVGEPDALPEPSSEEPQPTTRTAASRAADRLATRRTRHSVAGCGGPETDPRVRRPRGGVGIAAKGMYRSRCPRRTRAPIV